MAVGHGIGLGVGDTEAIAVVQSSDAPLTDPPVLVEPATLRVSATAATLGAPAGEPGVLSGFASRVGDPDGVTAADGTVYLAEDLVATATASLLATAVRQFPGLPADPTVVAIHPARWDDTTVAAQRAAFDRAGLAAVSLTPDAVAAVRWFEAAHGATGESVVAVCDFAAAGLTVSLVRTGAEPRLLPPSTFSSLFGGDSFDRTIAEHVLGTAAADLGPLDPADPGVRADVERLHVGCRTAKEQLSTIDETTIDVTVGGAAAAVTLTRADLDEMLRGPLEGALSLVEETLRAHELAPSALHTVLLTGGGAAMPLLSELTGALPAPATVAPHPNVATVQGAAILAAGGAGRSGTAGGAGQSGTAGGAALGAAAAVASAGPGVDVSGDADTDSLPVVPTPATPTAFTEAGPGSTVQPAAAVTPAAPAPARNRLVMVAAGVGAALVVAAIAGAVTMSRSGDTPGTPLPHLDPLTTSARAVTTTRATTPPPVATTTEIEVDTVTPTTAPPTRTAAPVTTTVALPPPVATTTRPVTTTKTTTEPEDTTPPEETTTTDDTTTTTTTTTTEPEPEPEPETEGTENP
ncbi:Hsp70 family protein [Rhodococcus sp. NPDC004095]